MSGGSSTWLRGDLTVAGDGRPVIRTASVIPADYCSAEGLNRALAEVVRRQTGADLAMVYCGGPRYALSLAAGETRAMDLLAWEYTRRIAVMELTGREILNYAKAPKTDARGRSRFLPAEKIDTLDPERTYRIAMPAHAISDYGKRTGNNPLSYRLIDATMYDAMKSFSWSAKAKQ